MAQVIELPNGFRILDYNWITGHIKVFLLNNSNAEFYHLLTKADCVSPNSQRFTLQKGAQSYVISLLTLVAFPKLIPNGTFTNRTVEFGISDAGAVRTLKIRVTRTSPSNGADEIWDSKLRVLIPMNGITDTDITEQLNRSNVEGVDIIQ